MKFFAELKRRNVFRVGIAYCITAWLIAQMAGLAADSFGTPDWVMKMLITLLILGLPIALVMAWAYEMTPDGLRRETGLEPGHSTSPSAGKLDRTIAIALVVALAYIAYDKFVIDSNRNAAGLESTVQQSAGVAPQSEQIPKPLVATEQSIAVLPFLNISDDGGNEYFAEGLSEELLNQLVKIPELQVAAQTSSFSFKGKDVKIAQIAKELNVTHVLEGSVRKAGNHVRISAKLIKADNGFQLWSETYDRNLNDIFVVQDDIARQVVAALKVTLMGALPKVLQTDPEVYSLYLQGRFFGNLEGKENFEKARVAFEQALAIDPDYAPAWIAMSVVYQNQRQSGLLTSEQAFALSMTAIERALAIDSNMAAAWAALAYMKKNQLDWTGAKAALDKALILEPNNALVIGTAASLAGNLGQLETSIELFERNVTLDPLSLSSLRALAIRYSNAERFDEALEIFNRVFSINPDYPGIHISFGVTYLLAGDPQTALTEINKDTSWPTYAFHKVKVLSMLGDEVEAQAMMNELLETTAHQNPAAMAAVYAWRGENDLAFEWLEKAFEQRPGAMTYFLGNALYKVLETDPRYPVFVEKLGLLEAWKSMPRPDEEVLQ